MTLHIAPEIQAVLFDFGMVLSGPPDAAVWARMLEISGLDEAPLHAGYWAHRHEYDRGTLKGPVYWQAVARHAGSAFDTAQVEALIAADTDLWTDMNVAMVEWAQRLQRAGVRTGILSNIGDSIAEGICAKLPWLSAFDHCTWSHALGMAKPERAIYEKTAELLGTAPEHILFLDDKEENIAMAKTAGMQAIQYDGHSRFEREMRARGLGWLLDVGETLRGDQVRR
ncbi:MAG: HAD family phosphatase [Acidobacteriaceae bacterium]